MAKASFCLRTAGSAALICLVGFLSACAGGGKPETAPGGVSIEAKRAEAAGLVARGHYEAFKKAATIYADLYALKAAHKSVAADYVKTLVLLRIRERQLSIQTSHTVDTALAVIGANPELAGLKFYIEHADLVASRTRGIQVDFADTHSYARWTQADFEKSMKAAQATQADLRAKTTSADYYAFAYLAFYASYAAGRDGQEDYGPIFALFPESRLMLYMNAMRTTKEKPDLLERLTAADSEFYEAWFHLGELALGERNLLSAEADFLKAEAGLVDSPQVFIYLASIYTTTEEFEKSLSYYDRTLALSPGYRDALLGKAISLSYLGRYREAIEVLGKMVELGNWLMGEAHYWLAWNRHALDEDAAAQAHIEESKGRLPTNSEVFGLAGTIALDLIQFDRAEKEFKEALKYNGGNVEALFGLGRISDSRSNWQDASLYYDLAAEVVGRNEAAIETKIAEIKAAPMAEDRRARMLKKKENQLLVTRVTRATAFYNAAASWLNLGRPDKARPAAERAAAHPQFKEKATALLARMK
ncbi:MAG: tetratricopeptide repeat protein [Candidatus Aminicenantes bacterium]|nr:tetratricopeptide repeat protein [Candidatus Aminicenantes bacterium]